MEGHWAFTGGGVSGHSSKPYTFSSALINCPWPQDLGEGLDIQAGVD